MRLVRIGNIKMDFPTLRKHKIAKFIDHNTGKEVKFNHMVIVDYKGFVCVEVPENTFGNGEIANG